MDALRRLIARTLAGARPRKPLQRLSAEIVEQVERQLAGRTRDIRLHDELDRRFRERFWPQTSKIIRAWMMWVIVLDALTLALNAALLPIGTVQSMVPAALIIPPAAFAAATVLAKPRPLWAQGTAVLLSVFLILLSVALVGVNTGGEFYERHLTIMLFVAVTAIVIFPVPLSWSVAIGVYAVGLYLFFQLHNPTIVAGSALAATLFFASGVAATLVARHTATILAQKTFLLELRDQSRLAELADANASLELLARTDPLTGVSNRRSMAETIRRCWNEPAEARRYAAMLMCDIDDFKKLNDSLGHGEGDRCLVKVAGIIQSSLRNENDQVARYGGEEFLVLLPGATEEVAIIVAETIRSRVEAAALANPTSRVAPHVTMSIGLASYQADRETVSSEQLLRRADAALYSAKASGRNRVDTYSAGAGHTEVNPQSGREAFHEPDSTSPPVRIVHQIFYGGGR